MISRMVCRANLLNGINERATCPSTENQAAYKWYAVGLESASVTLIHQPWIIKLAG